VSVKWFLQKCTKRVPINEAILKAQVVQSNKALSRDEKCKASEVCRGRFDMIYAKLTLKQKLHLVRAVAKQFPETLHKAIQVGEYSVEQVLQTAPKQ
jgi:ribosomal protein S7